MRPIDTRRLILSSLLFLCLASCAQNPVTGQPDFVLMTEAQEIRLGAQTDQEVKKQYPLYDLNGLQAYVEGIGQKLAKHSHRPGLEYRFTVLDSGEVNAFALPGGRIYITRGIIAYLNSEAELAAVLGHELGHVTARHSVRQYSAAKGADILLSILSATSPALRGAGAQNLAGLFGNALLAGYGREHELEADRLGAEYLARAGYDPQAMIRVIGVLKNQESFEAEVAKQEGREPRSYHGLFASHPDNDRRLQEVVGAAQKFRLEAAAEGREAFFARTTGLVFGDNAHEGVRRGGAFYHADLGFAFKLPEGWRAQNRPDRLILTAPGDEARLQLSAVKRSNEAPTDMLRRLTRSRSGEVDPSPINGLPAAMIADGGVFAAIVYLRASAYGFSGAFRSQGAFRKHLEAMRSSVRSFHEITAEETALARPLTIKLVTAGEGARFAELAGRSPIGKYAEGHLRLINGLYPKGEPSPGQTIKVIE